jgi:hypothetical protein
MEDENIGPERSSAGNVDAVTTTLVAAGIIFQADGEMIAGGPGVRLALLMSKSIDTIENEVVQYPEFMKNDAPPGAGG